MSNLPSSNTMPLLEGSPEKIFTSPQPSDIPNSSTEHQSSSFPDKEVDGYSKLVPCVGMEFNSLEEADRFYGDYAQQEGFWRKTRSTEKAAWYSNNIVSKLFTCIREGILKSKEPTEEKDVEEINEKEQGKKNVKSCSTNKCDCKAGMRVSLDKSTMRWIVKTFHEEHNHKIVSPAKRMKMMSNKKFPKAARALTEEFSKVNLPIAKVPSILRGEQIGFDSRDCYNHMRNIRLKELEHGDAQSVLTYFQKMQVKNPQFFYALQVDDNGRAVNFFWVDARSRMAYEYFGDVVTFDTTYRTNKYDMPFAPFTGVNHHFQSIQFGCALLQDETELTFLWLFETWLEAMGGRAPVSILTDQDPAMMSAIAKVFPKTRHRLCIWHITKKFGEKLSHIYYRNSMFKHDMQKSLYSTYSVEQFEDQWKKIITTYDLQNNTWLSKMYEIRELWVPVYNRGTFFAGMNTTSRSEGVNAFFNDFVTSTTNLRNFVVKYEEALQRIVRKESAEDFNTEHKNRIVKEDEFLLQHAAKVYTRNIFNKFKEEWEQRNTYKIEEGERGAEFSTFVVISRKMEEQKFTVKLNLQNLEGFCECKYFEFIGILCRHMVKVLYRLDIDTIPDHFVLSRWKQEANKFRKIDEEEFSKICSNEESDVWKLSFMCQQSTKLACIAINSDKGSTIYINGLNEISKRLAELNLEEVENNKIQTQELSESASVNERNNVVETLLLDPNISLTKGWKKDSERIKSSIEIAGEKRKRKCQSCGKFATHDKRNCPLNQK